MVLCQVEVLTDVHCSVLTFFEHLMSDTAPLICVLCLWKPFHVSLTSLCVYIRIGLQYLECSYFATERCCYVSYLSVMLYYNIYLIIVHIFVCCYTSLCHANVHISPSRGPEWQMPASLDHYRAIMMIDVLAVAFSTTKGRRCCYWLMYQQYSMYTVSKKQYIWLWS